MSNLYIQNYSEIIALQDTTAIILLKMKIIGFKTKKLNYFFNEFVTRR